MLSTIGGQQIGGDRDAPDRVKPAGKKRQARSSGRRSLAHAPLAPSSRATVVPRPVGRPTKLTPEIAFRICQFIRLGNFREVAARACGIVPSTFHLWMRRKGDHYMHEDRELVERDGHPVGVMIDDRSQDEIKSGEPLRLRSTGDLSEFSDLIEHAEADLQSYLVGTMRTHSAQDWRSARELLAMRFPRQYPKEQKIAIESSGSASGDALIINVISSDRDARELKELNAAVEERIDRQEA